MKVCLVGSSGVPIPPRYGGAVERHIYDLAKALTTRGCDVQVLTMRSASSPRKQVMENVYINRGGFFRENSTTSATLLKHLSFFVYVLVKLSLMRSQSIIHAHNGIPGLAAVLVSEVRRIPLVFTSHTLFGSVGHQVFTEGTRLKTVFEDLQVTLEKFCALKASYTIAVSKKVGDDLASIGVKRGKVFNVPNGVDVRKFKQDQAQATRVRQKFNLGKGNVILYVGRIVQYKGLGALVDSAPEIAKKHPDVKFVITGPISYYQAEAMTSFYRELREKIYSKKLLDTFVFTGAVDEDDLMGLYSTCDIFVLPSIVEPFGMVLAEAMSCGKPVIGSRIDGILDIIDHGKDGFLVPPAQPLELASAINYLLDHPEERKRMGRNAALHARNEFDWSKVAQRIMEIYDKAIREY